MNKTQTHIGFIIEQALGHITHGQNLQANAAHDPDIMPHWGLPQFDVSRLAARIPVYKSNWTVRASLQARRLVAQMQRQQPLDVLFFHTQVTAVLAQNWLHKLPSVISLDATPRQYDSLGAYYQHESSPDWLEQQKWRLNRDAFRAAKQIVAWTEWTRDGLMAEYDVPAEKINVIPPGVNSAEWQRPTPRQRHTHPAKILFVGGDLQRKGGLDLLEAFRALRQNSPVELHLVTRTPVEPEPGLFVYHNMQPNSPALKQLYFDSDIFCLPTYGDCLPMVLSEAGAAGLPVVSTAVAGIPEIVKEGRNGYLVPTGDVAALKHALQPLVEQPDLRLALGETAVHITTTRFDAKQNALQLFNLLKSTAQHKDKPKPMTNHSTFAIYQLPFAQEEPAPDVLLTVSGTMPTDIRQQVAQGKRPLPDYLHMADQFNADLIDYPTARQTVGWFGHLLERIGGPNLLLAWACYQRRHDYRVIFTDGEQVGIPLTLLFMLFGGTNRPSHQMIVHILSVGKKMKFFDWFGIQKHIDTFFCYSTWQKQFIEQRWNVPPERLVWTPFMVDDQFFAPHQISNVSQEIRALPKPYICSVGLEFRDYPTLMEAVKGLDVHVVIAAGSPWSKRDDSTQQADIPDNVTVRRFTQYELRQIYADAAFVVMPLYDVQFQAGVTAILEGMALGKAIVCSRTPGQTDVIVEGEHGLYATPEDSADLRRAIVQLLENPAEAARMGQNGRSLIETEMSLYHYVRRLKQYVHPQATQPQKPVGEWAIK